MGLHKTGILFIGGMLLLAASCDNNSTPGDQSTVENVEVTSDTNQSGMKAVEGATPALPDKQEDMALIAKETKQNESDKAAIKEEVDKDLDKIESEKMSNQQSQERSP